MNQRAAIFLFVVLAIVGITAAAINAIGVSVKNVGSSGPTPTPTPELQLFNTEKKDQQQVSNQNQPTPKQIKQYRQFPGLLAPEELKSKKAVIETNKGNIEFEIYPEATKAASNFVFLVRDGFYDSLTFHRVVPDFVIQGGDPKGDGTGGPGYQFEDEEVTKKYDRGVVAMANAGPDTNGSQFFIMLADNPSLPPKYTIFGKVISGIDTVDKITVGDIMQKVSIQQIEQK